MIVVDTSIYAPLITACVECSSRQLRGLDSQFSTSQFTRACNAFWRDNTGAWEDRIEGSEVVKACKAGRVATRHVELYSVEGLDALRP